VRDHRTGSHEVTDHQRTTIKARADDLRAHGASRPKDRADS
jgi:hypothetical protein